MRRILICGSRTWENPAPIEYVIDRDLLNGRRKSSRKEDLLVITGGAPGVDTLAEQACKKLGIHVARVDALWDTYGRSAGPRRNGVMLSLDPELVIAFHFSRERLTEDVSGTARCMQQARSHDIPVKLKLVPLDLAMPSAADVKRKQAAKKKRPRKRA